jgi:alkylation response protein AidB-like acyl-CoA dehydrogenase
LDRRKETKYAGSNQRVAAHTSPYPVSRLGAVVSLVDSAQVIEAASETVALRTNSQLQSIVEQMQALQEKARSILERAERDLELHQAECRFQRVAGRVYHLYRKVDGRRYFSMLDPEDYGADAPHEHVGSYRYEADESWTPLEEIEARDKHLAEIQQFVSARLLPPSDE